MNSHRPLLLIIAEDLDTDLERLATRLADRFRLHLALHPVDLAAAEALGLARRLGGAQTGPTLFDGALRDGRITVTAAVPVARASDTSPAVDEYASTHDIDLVMAWRRPAFDLPSQPSGRRDAAVVTSLSRCDGDLSPAMVRTLDAAAAIVLPARACIGELDRGEFDGDLADALRERHDKLVGIAAGPALPPPVTRIDRRAARRKLQFVAGLEPSRQTTTVVAVGAGGDAAVSAEDAAAIAATGVQLILYDSADAAAIASECGPRCAALDRDTLPPAEALAGADIVLAAGRDDRGVVAAAPQFGALPVVPRLGASSDWFVDLDESGRTGSAVFYSAHLPGDAVRAVRRATDLARRSDLPSILSRACRVGPSWRVSTARYAALLADAIAKNSLATALVLQ